MWHHHFFGAHIVEAVLLHFGEGPLDCSFESLRAAETMADGIGQYRQAAPGERVADRFTDEPGRGLPIRREPGR